MPCLITRPGRVLFFFYYYYYLRCILKDNIQRNNPRNERTHSECSAFNFTSRTSTRNKVSVTRDTCVRAYENPFPTHSLKVVSKKKKINSNCSALNETCGPADGKPEERRSLYACRQAKQPEGSHVRCHLQNIHFRLRNRTPSWYKSAQPPSFYYWLQNTRSDRRPPVA